MKATLLCLLLLSLIVLSFANNDLDQHLRADARKSNAISAFSYGSNHFIFARGIDRFIYFNQFTGSSWVGWLKLGNVTFIGAPSSSSWSPTRFDVFAIDDDNHLRQSTFASGTWTYWNDLGSTFLPTLRATSSAIGQITVVVQDLTKKGIAYSWNPNSGWTSSPLGNYVLDGTISAAPRTTSLIELYGISNSNVIRATSNNRGITWTQFAPSFPGSGTHFGVPAISRWPNDQNRLDVFTLTPSNSVTHFFWSTSTGWGQEPLAGAYTSDLSAVGWGFNRIDLFGLGGNSNLYWKSFNGAWNNNPVISSATYISAPTATSAGSGLLSVFLLNQYGEVTWGLFNSASQQWTFSSVGTNKFLA